MQHKAVYLLFCKFTVHVPGVNHAHHEYTKLLLQRPALVMQLPPSNVAKPRWREVAAQKYDQYRRL